jgi:DNA-directed RNA polymerase subunit RPC12/RpoP
MKKRYLIIPAIISCLLAVGVFLYKVFVDWGVSYFEKNFSFIDMVLPCILMTIPFFLLLEILLLCFLALKSYFKKPKEERQQIRQKAAQKRIEDMELQRKMVAESPPVVRCAKCGSQTLSANTKGFGIGKAVVGAAVFGLIGLTAGNINAKKVYITCLNCGHRWTAGKK